MIIGIQDEILKLNQDGLLDILLRDMTTKSNIIWGTDAYAFLGKGYYQDEEIKSKLIIGKNNTIIKNRAIKDLEQQTERIKEHAEVFTPFWVCKLMIDYLDKAWLSGKTLCLYEDEIDLEHNKIWDIVDDDDWKDYVKSRRLELTCGEAPYLVTRYDVSTGDTILMSERTGILDRKLAVVGKYVDEKKEWMKWAFCAISSIYGYEFQGDSLLIARLNILMTFSEFYEEKFKNKPPYEDLKKAAEIIVWNIWQMDGLTYKIPYSNEVKEQISIFNILNTGSKPDESNLENNEIRYCVSRIWNYCGKNTAKEICIFKIKNGEEKMFDYIIGNPPYQEDTENTSDKPIYNLFMSSAYKIGQKVELVTPARFLFGAGKTPKDFTKSILNDKHFKVLDYEPDASKVFPNVTFTGGVAIHYYDSMGKFEPIGFFTQYNELNSILNKVRAKEEESLTGYFYGPTRFNLSSLYYDYPEIQSLVSSDGKEKRLTTDCFTYPCFHDVCESSDDIRILGLLDNRRVYKFINRKYINCSEGNINNYKVIVPKSNGSGAIGEVNQTPLIGEPVIGEKTSGYTQTFISVGSFETQDEAEACLKYVKTKFARTLLGILKVTQDNNPKTWKNVPIQRFTVSSDIDWNKPMSDIDKQLYAKYELTNDEISFIEDKVAEMG